MARRLTPDPLQTDPWTEPVRIRLPVPFRYVAIRQDVTFIEDNYTPIQTVSNQDDCGGFGLVSASYIHQYVDARLQFDETTLSFEPAVYVSRIRKEPLGVGSTRSKEASLWQGVSQFTDWIVSNFNPTKPSGSNTSTENAGTGNGRCSAIGGAMGGQARLDVRGSVEPLTYVEDSELYGAVPLDSDTVEKFRYPRNDGPIYRNGSPVCCADPEDEWNNHILHFAGEYVEWYKPYDAASGVTDVTVQRPNSDKVIPLKPVAWAPGLDSTVWIFERTDIDFSDEDNGGS